MAVVLRHGPVGPPDSVDELAGLLLDIQHDLAEVTSWLVDHWPSGVPAPELDESSLRSEGVALRLWASMWEVSDFVRLVEVFQSRPVPLDRHPHYVAVTRRFGSVLIEAWFDTDQWERAMRQSATPVGEGGDRS
jgi:hypothetical protein